MFYVLCSMFYVIVVSMFYGFGLVWARVVFVVSKTARSLID